MLRSARERRSTTCSQGAEEPSGARTMSVVVFEIERAEASHLGAGQARNVGRLLAADSDVLAVWLVNDGAHASSAVPRLQFAVEAVRSSVAARRIWPMVERIQAQCGLKLALLHFAREWPDVVPQVVADLLGLDVTPNRSTLVSVLKGPVIGTDRGSGCG